MTTSDLPSRAAEAQRIAEALEQAAAERYVPITAAQAATLPAGARSAPFLGDDEAARAARMLNAGTVGTAMYEWDTEHHEGPAALDLHSLQPHERSVLGYPPPSPRLRSLPDAALAELERLLVEWHSARLSFLASPSTADLDRIHAAENAIDAIAATHLPAKEPTP